MWENKESSATPEQLLSGSSQLHPRTQQMVTTAQSVQWTVVASEIEALTLEFQWIKELNPAFQRDVQGRRCPTPTLLFPWVNATHASRSREKSINATRSTTAPTPMCGPFEKPSTSFYGHSRCGAVQRASSIAQWPNNGPVCLAISRNVLPPAPGKSRG